MSSIFQKKKKEFKPVGDDDLDDYNEEEKVCFNTVYSIHTIFIQSFWKDRPEQMA